MELFPKKITKKKTITDGPSSEYHENIRNYVLVVRILNLTASLPAK